MIFREEGNAWLPVAGAPRFASLQDPCITMLDGRLLLGGVRFPVVIGMEVVRLREES